ncbi:MAG: thymidylate kinase [Paraprevotella sp.]|nr:thymidylate kinase [Paraprevotella sp.]
MAKYIIISGVDGSGKTTVIEGVKAALEADGKKVGYIWMRYHHKLVTVMHAIAKVTGLAKKEKTEMGEMWLHYFYKSRLFSWLYIRCSYIDNWLARKMPVRLAEREGLDFVICDRWVNDIIIDMGSEIHKTDILQTKWYGRYQRLLPDGSYQFVVIRGREEVLDCRVENTFNEAFSYRYDLYQQITEKPEIYKVDNTGTIENSIQQVLKLIV